MHIINLIFIEYHKVTIYLLPYKTSTVGAPYKTHRYKVQLLNRVKFHKKNDKK